jgi:hypothetical protein
LFLELKSVTHAGTERSRDPRHAPGFQKRRGLAERPGILPGYL